MKILNIKKNNTKNNKGRHNGQPKINLECFFVQKKGLEMA